MGVHNEIGNHVSSGSTRRGAKSFDTTAPNRTKTLGTRHAIAWINDQKVSVGSSTQHTLAIVDTGQTRRA
jgi:UDP-N-acetylmuramoylalanine-D-glutamate ligase